MKSFLISLFLTCLVSSFSEYVIDTQAALSIDQIACFYDKEFSLFVGRVYDPAGFIDETGIQNLINAGLTNIPVEAYMSPCVSGNCQNNLTSAEDQVNAVINRLGQEDLDVFLWIAIERGSWSTNQVKNQDFVIDLLRTVYRINQQTGVMTSQSTWTYVVGNFTYASKFANSLWWVNWNAKPDSSGFTPFGGWNNVTYHQYAGGITTDNCAQGLPLDYSYYSEDFFARRNAQMAKRSARLHKFARN